MRKFTGLAGQPLNHAIASQSTNGGCQGISYVPFSSEFDWDLAHWAKLYGPSETSFTKLLAILTRRVCLVGDSICFRF